MNYSPAFRKATVVGVISIMLLGLIAVRHARSQTPPQRTIATEADFQRAMKELSNWGRWGANDELGAANLITPAKRKQAVTLAREGVSISLAHDIVQETAPDAPTILERTM